MTTFVRFTLFGPMASWGDVAVGPARPTRATPTRSAVLGIVAASLGLDRADTEAQRTLTEEWNVAAMTLSAGRLMRDYHTVQSTPQASLAKAKRSGFWPRTRRRALQAGARFGEVVTTLTERDYRSDHLSVICLWPTKTATRWQALELVDALRKPVFVPYLGRKSCPLAAPMAPELVDAQGPIPALEAWQRGAHFGAVGERERAILTWDVDDRFPMKSGVSTNQRRDRSSDRVQWHFDERLEAMCLAEPREES